jgi:Zn-dependent peptidase ImmA (M78 family)
MNAESGGTLGNIMAIHQDAENAAKRLLATRDITTVPVDPVRIARALGLDVITANLPPNVGGALVKNTGQDPSILLNAADHPNRQRFTCAHELGHYIRRSAHLEAYEYIDYRDSLSSTGASQEEVWANAFAAALLMPADKVRSMNEDSGEIELALQFGVSREAMHLRLKNLGLLRQAEVV